MKSGQTVSLKIDVRSALTTGSRLAMVSGLRDLAQRQGLGEVGEPGHVVEVRVGDQRVVDLDLFSAREGGPDSTAVDQE